MHLEPSFADDGDVKEWVPDFLLRGTGRLLPQCAEFHAGGYRAPHYGVHGMVNDPTVEDCRSQVCEQATASNQRWFLQACSCTLPRMARMSPPPRAFCQFPITFSRVA